MEPHHFVFICQGGELEAKSVLFAASFRCRANGYHHLTAAIPGPAELWPQPEPQTLQTLESLGVRLSHVQNSVGRDYPYGNKMECLSIPTDCSATVYIDSDILMMRDFGDDVLPERPLCAVPASLSHAKEHEWASFYAAYGLDMPEWRQLTLISQEPTPPYFNGGLLVVRNVPAFGETWAESCRTLREIPGIPNKIRNRFLDQFGVTIAAARLNLEISMLPMQWNFPSWSLELGDQPTPIFFHYQTAERLLQEDRIVTSVKEVCEQYPRVQAVFGRFPAYAQLLGSAEHP
ncbi:hypothetical protein [Dyella sp.]|uniref:hypothetical protein n=1 Tax=Dyella sp. TaxID=1869338 RepID=UPI002FD9108A